MCIQILCAEQRTEREGWSRQGACAKLSKLFYFYDDQATRFNTVVIFQNIFNFFISKHANLLKITLWPLKKYHYKTLHHTLLWRNIITKPYIIHWLWRNTWFTYTCTVHIYLHVLCCLMSGQPGKKIWLTLNIGLLLHTFEFQWFQHILIW